MIIQNAPGAQFDNEYTLPPDQAEKLIELMKAEVAEKRGRWERDRQIRAERKRLKPRRTASFPADATVVTVTYIKGRNGDMFRKMDASGAAWILDAVLRSGSIFRLIGAPDDKPRTLPVRVRWPASMGREDDKIIMQRRNFARGWGYQAKMQTEI